MLFHMSFHASFVMIFVRVSVSQIIFGMRRKCTAATKKQNLNQFEKYYFQVKQKNKQTKTNLTNPS